MSGSKFCKKATGNASYSKNTKASEVTIQIGVMIWKNRKLATRRGSSFPLKVPSNAISDFCSYLLSFDVNHLLSRFCLFACVIFGISLQFYSVCAEV